MTALRRHLLCHCGWAIWLLAAAMLVRLGVPAGFMVDTTGQGPGLVLCSGYGPDTMATMASVAGHHDNGHGKTGSGDHRDLPCGFSGHAPAAVTLVDPVLLALAIAFIVAATFRITKTPPWPAVPHLRPHPRGPPLTA